MIVGGRELLKAYGYDVDKQKVKAIILVDRKKKVIDADRYRFRILSMIVFLGEFRCVFSYNDCKNKCEYYEFSVDNVVQEMFSFTKCPYILEYDMDPVNLKRSQRILNDEDRRYYEKIKELYDLGDPNIFDCDDSFNIDLLL